MKILYIQNVSFSKANKSSLVFCCVTVPTLFDALYSSRCRKVVSTHVYIQSFGLSDSFKLTSSRLMVDGFPFTAMCFFYGLFCILRETRPVMYSYLKVQWLGFSGMRQLNIPLLTPPFQACIRKPMVAVKNTRVALIAANVWFFHSGLL